MSEVLRTATLLFMLLNPFLLVVYLIDAVERLALRTFAAVLLQAAMIACVVFAAFAYLGDKIFVDLLQADFASFQIFGGVVFLLIGLQFVFRGPRAIEGLRGETSQLAGVIAMPVFIGPGTISAAVIAGKRHEPLVACAVIVVVMLASALVIIGLKFLHDWVRPRSEPLVERYIEVTGRIAALVVGTISVEMIMVGLRAWLAKP